MQFDALSTENAVFTFLASDGCEVQAIVVPDDDGPVEKGEHPIQPDLDFIVNGGVIPLKRK